jgi:flavin-dependent dehydrogenase
LQEEWTNESARRIPVRYHADVVVVGGGVSGVAAAIAAARNGARTLLIERHGFCGGNAVIYLPFLSFLDQQGNEVVRGIGKEIIERVVELGGCVGNTRDPLHISYAPVDPEVVKRVVNEKLEEAGVNELLHTFVTDVQVSEHRITSFAGKQKRSERSNGPMGNRCHRRRRCGI